MYKRDQLQVLLVILGLAVSACSEPAEPDTGPSVLETIQKARQTVAGWTQNRSVVTASMVDQVTTPVLLSSERLVSSLYEARNDPAEVAKLAGPPGCMNRAADEFAGLLRDQGLEIGLDRSTANSTSVLTGEFYELSYCQSQCTYEVYVCLGFTTALCIGAGPVCSAALAACYYAHNDCQNWCHSRYSQGTY